MTAKDDPLGTKQGRTIKVPKSQMPKHLKHGDKLGACKKKNRKVRRP